jgi:hypothetical protein
MLEQHQNFAVEKKGHAMNMRNEIGKKSNYLQRLNIAAVVPIMMVLLAWGLMSIIKKYSAGHYPNNCGWHFKPSILGESWWEWLFVIASMGAFEYVFRDRS